MDDTTVTIEIVVTRVADGRTCRCAAKVQATEELASNNAAYLANRISKNALKILMPHYANVSKTIEEPTEGE